MATVLPFIQKDAFGGPAGSTDRAMQMLISGILQGAEKRRLENQREQLSNNFQAWRKENPEAPIGNFVDTQIAGNYDPNVIGNFMQNVATASQINLQDARAQNLRNPKPEERVEIEYWDPEGKMPGGKRRVPESSYNKAAEYYESKGYVTQKPETKSKQTSEFERLLDKVDKAGNLSEAQKNDFYFKRINKLISQGGDTDKTNKITLGDGQKVTLAELRAQYREKYNIPDEFELMLMESSNDPRMRQQALKLKSEAATKPTFVEFMRDAREYGLEGLRQEITPTVIRGNVPELPPGFILD